MGRKKESKSIVHLPEGDEEFLLKKSREVVESYIFASSKRDLSIYSERLLMHLVAIAQRHLDGNALVDSEVVSINSLGDAHVEIQIKDLLGGSDVSNYIQAKEAIKELMLCPSFIERPKRNSSGRVVLDKEGNPEMEMFGFQLLNNCEVNVKPGVAVLDVNSNTWRALLDFSKGFRKYNLAQAMSLMSCSSLRLYRLMANQTRMMTYSIDKLRQMWGMEEKEPKTGAYVKYPNNSNFVKKVIDAAKRELDEKSPWSFEYSLVYGASVDEQGRPRRGRAPITGITFTPTYDVSKDAYAVVEDTGEILGRELYNALRVKLGFDEAGIRNNMKTFRQALAMGFDILDFIYEVAPSALSTQKPQGYFISALRRAMKERQGK